jgi:hypothetical protein
MDAPPKNRHPQITNLCKPISLRYLQKKTPAGLGDFTPLAASPLLVRMHPLIRRDLLRRGQLDHVHQRRVATPSALIFVRDGLNSTLPDAVPIGAYRANGNGNVLGGVKIGR